MQPMQHQLMGYDRAITMFSPDGRLLQVEYAKKTVKQGSTAIGITCEDGVVLLTDKRIVDSLIVAESVEKIYQVDDHVIATASGILPDARVLVERAQSKAQQHLITFDSPVDVITVVKDLTSLMQMTTQSGGYRPFGVAMLVGGVDKDDVHLYQTDPVGVYHEFNATAIGEKGQEASDILRDKWKPGLSIEDGIELAVEVLREVLGGKLDKERVDCAYVDREMQVTRLDEDEVQEYLKK